MIKDPVLRVPEKTDNFYFTENIKAVCSMVKRNQQQTAFFNIKDHSAEEYYSGYLVLIAFRSSTTSKKLSTSSGSNFEPESFFISFKTSFSSHASL